jgi:putative ABC transport system permease protein
MRIWRRLRSGWGAIFGRARVESELDAELRFHVEAHAEDLVRAGLSREEALRQARVKLGGLERTKEECREALGVSFVESFIQDVRFGLRKLRKNPGFTAVAVVTLALGIGANTAIFSVVYAVLLKPLPFSNPSRLSIIWQTDAAHRATGAYFDTYREFEEWQQDSKSFEKLAAITWARVNTTMRLHGKVESVVAIPVSADFFSALGVRTARGRTFNPEDSQNSCTAVLSDGFWHGELGSVDVVGRTLTINENPCLVVGIMPKEFSFYPKQTQLWTLIPPGSEYAKNPWTSVVGVVGLLKPGVTRASAEAELAALQKRIIGETTIPILRQAEPVVLDLHYDFVWLTGRNLRSGLIVLFAAVTFVLLIACVNLATMFLGRAIERQQEFGIRAALGATRGRTMRQSLTEALLLATGGALVGALAAAVSIRYLNSASPVELPPGNPITMDWRVLGFTALLAILSVAVFALVPAWRASRYDLDALLKRDSRGSHRAAKVFIVAEVAFSLMLLGGASLLTESLLRLTSTPLGFQSAHLVAGDINLPGENYRIPARRLAFCDEVKSRVVDLPGVQGVAFGPLGEGASNTLDIEGRPALYREDLQNSVSVSEVDADYFRVMGIPLRKGKEFDASDEQKTLPVAIVNDALVRKFFNGDPIGQHVRFWQPGNNGRWLTIIGVVGNVKGFTAFKEMGYVTDPIVYVPLGQATDPRVRFGILVRSTLGAGSLIPEVRDAFTRVDANLPPPNLTTATDWLSQFYAQPRLRAVSLSVFAGLGLLLCGIGIFGVLSQSVTQRRHEIGIRMALGAQPRDILRGVLGQGARVTLAGIAIGVVASLSLSRLMAAMLYGVTATDPLTFAAVVALLLAVALLACWIPARRAMRVDPMATLRHE